MTASPPCRCLSTSPTSNPTCAFRKPPRSSPGCWSRRKKTGQTLCWLRWTTPACSAYGGLRPRRGNPSRCYHDTDGSLRARPQARHRPVIATITAPWPGRRKGIGLRPRASGAPLPRPDRGAVPRRVFSKSVREGTPNERQGTAPPRCGAAPRPLRRDHRSRHRRARSRHATLATALGCGQSRWTEHAAQRRHWCPVSRKSM